LLPRGQAPLPVNSLKRKRRTGLSISTGFRATLTPRSPPIGSLVDYADEDEDQGSVTSMHDITGSPRHDLSLLMRPQSPSLLSSPRLLNRQVSPLIPPRHSSPDDDEDNLLEALVRTKEHNPSPAIATPKVPNLGLGPMRLTGKRQREDDDDDELLERLASKTKRPDLGAERVLAVTGGRTGSKPGDDPPKKIKLKFGLTSLGAAPTSPYVPPSKAGAKDGDTG
jgi:protein phosphatase-4 regulatory subunit 3